MNEVPESDPSRPSANAHTPIMFRPSVGIEPVPTRSEMNFVEYADAFPVHRHRRCGDFKDSVKQALAEFGDKYQALIDRSQTSWMAGLMCFGFEDTDKDESPIEFIIQCPNVQRAAQDMMGANTVSSFPLRIVPGRFVKYMARSPRNAEYHRPLRVGCSIGKHGQEHSATIGCFFRGLHSDGSQAIYGLTCAHVAKTGDFIQQPSRPDADAIQRNLEYKNYDSEQKARIQANDFDIGSVTVVDATADMALVRLNDGLDLPNNIMGHISELADPHRDLDPLPDVADLQWTRIGKLDAIQQDQFGDLVFKRGRSTNITEGCWHEVEYVGRFQSDDNAKIWRLVVRSPQFAAAGDSGAAVGCFDRDGNGTILGVLHGADMQYEASYYVVGLDPFVTFQEEKNLRLQLL